MKIPTHPALPVSADLEPVVAGAVGHRLDIVRVQYYQSLVSLQAELDFLSSRRPRTQTEEAIRQTYLARRRFIGPMLAVLEAVATNEAWAGYRWQVLTLAEEMYPLACRADSNEPAGFFAELWAEAMELVTCIVCWGGS